VDPLVDETGQAYAYIGDDPVNGTDPMGAISAGQICGMDGLNSQACRGAIQISAQVGKEVAANQVSGCAPIIDIAGAIAQHVEAHPWATVGLIAGTAALFLTDGADSELVIASADDLAGSATDVSVAGQLRTGLALTAVGADAEDCAQQFGINESCAAAGLGLSSFPTGNPVDEVAAWSLALAAYLR